MIPQLSDYSSVGNLLIGLTLKYFKSKKWTFYPYYYRRDQECVQFTLLTLISVEFSHGTRLKLFIYHFYNIIFIELKREKMNAHVKDDFKIELRSKLVLFFREGAYLWIQGTHHTSTTTINDGRLTMTNF